MCIDFDGHHFGGSSFVYVMCIDFDGHHSGGSSFVYVNVFCYYRNCLYTHRYKFSSKEKKNR